MEHMESITQDQAVKRKPRNKALPSGSASKERERKNNMSEEENNLAAHVSLCHLRYQQLEQRLNGMEKRLDTLAADLSTLKASTQQNFNEIKMLLERRSTATTNQIIASIGTVLAALAGGLYLLLK